MQQSHGSLPGSRWPRVFQTQLLVAALVLRVGAGAGVAEGGRFAVTLHRHRRLLEDDGRPAGHSFYWGPRNLYATEYFGLLAVGTPRQCLKVAFDTGSGNLILPSSDCADAACLAHARYNASLSSTAVAMRSADSPPGAVLAPGRARDTLKVTFGTGEVTGTFSRDRACVGHLCAQLALVTATNMSAEPFEAVPFDGILGLGLPQLSEEQGFSFVDALVKGGGLKRNLFSVYFSQAEAAGSEVLFGDFREELLAEPLTWAAVTNPGFWQVALKDVTVNGGSLNFCASGCQAAFDTGTSLLTAPTRWARQLAQRLRVAGDCSNFEELPDIGFVLNGKVLTLSPEDYVDRSDDGCVLSLMALDVPAPRGPLFILGDPLLRKYYTVYDRERLRVGVALARHPPGGLPTELPTGCAEDLGTGAAVVAV